MWMERADAWQLYINFWCVLVLGRVPYWPESVRKETQKERKRARVVVERQFINCLWLLELKAQSNRKQKIILKIDSSGCFSSPSWQALASLTRITYHWELFQRYLKVSAQVKDTKKQELGTLGLPVLIDTSRVGLAVGTITKTSCTFTSAKGNDHELCHPGEWNLHIQHIQIPLYNTRRKSVYREGTSPELHRRCAFFPLTPQPSTVNSISEPGRALGAPPPSMLAFL